MAGCIPPGPQYFRPHYRSYCGNAELLGAVFLHVEGTWIDILGSALVASGVIGNFVGKRMDKQDPISMTNAMTRTPNRS
ncbi:hypothetical protein [Coxiella-like endosymbiont]|uniref:hypothetical protein n=1 Tax=Coxiella-like endosymbiont TaxID=1592897 RepID=UPI00272B19EF|nr:hypothetical protein [Coxiella-like endosymbiont]